MPNPAIMRHMALFGGIVLLCIVYLGYKAVKKGRPAAAPAVSGVEADDAGYTGLITHEPVPPTPEPAFAPLDPSALGHSPALASGRDEIGDTPFAYGDGGTTPVTAMPPAGSGGASVSHALPPGIPGGGDMLALAPPSSDGTGRGASGLGAPPPSMDSGGADYAPVGIGLPPGVGETPTLSVAPPSPAPVHTLPPDAFAASDSMTPPPAPPATSSGWGEPAVDALPPSIHETTPVTPPAYPTPPDASTPRHGGGSRRPDAEGPPRGTGEGGSGTGRRGGGSSSATPTRISVPPPSDASAPGRPYTVREFDSLSTIAQRELGSARRWKDIAELNKKNLPNPDKLRVGQVVYLPQDRAETPVERPAAPAATAEAASASRALTPITGERYTVRPGDSLTSIAQARYQNPLLAARIIQLNKDALAQRDNRLEVGMVLHLPALPPEQAEVLRPPPAGTVPGAGLVPGGRRTGS